MPPCSSLERQETSSTKRSSAKNWPRGNLLILVALSICFWIFNHDLLASIAQLQVAILIYLVGTVMFGWKSKRLKSSQVEGSIGERRDNFVASPLNGMPVKTGSLCLFVSLTECCLWQKSRRWWEHRYLYAWTLVSHGRLTSMVRNGCYTDVPRYQVNSLHRTHLAFLHWWMFLQCNG